MMAFEVAGVLSSVTYFRGPTNRLSSLTACVFRRLPCIHKTFCDTHCLLLRRCHYSCCRCYNCGGLDHHAKECSLPPQPKKCHYCQSITHMVANCPHKTAAQPPASSQGRQEADSQPGPAAFPREAAGGPGRSPPPCPQEARPEVAEWPGRSPQEASSTKSAAAPGEQSKKGPSVQKRKKT